MRTTTYTSGLPAGLSSDYSRVCLDPRPLVQSYKRGVCGVPFLYLLPPPFGLEHSTAYHDPVSHTMGRYSTLLYSCHSASPCFSNHVSYATVIFGERT